MPLSLVRAESNEQLWGTCASRFLDEIGKTPGPSGIASRLWVTHRNHRDLVLEEAARLGLPGWLGAPVSFFSELPRLFEIRDRPVGLLTRRRLVSRLAAQAGGRIGISGQGSGHGVIRGHMLEGLFSELLPEGVVPEELWNALGKLDGDAFTQKRNEWITEVYAKYPEELSARGLYDPRSIHAMVAARIEAGDLRAVLNGASRLHIYGVYSIRTRRRLFAALARQEDVEVIVYLPQESDSEEWETLAGRAEILDAPPPAKVEVQPAPGASRELEWVAREVKKLLANGQAEPHEIALVARSGREDTRRAHQALKSAGVPATARIRTPLAEIAALKAFLSVFRGAARGWSYATLRPVLDNPYFWIGVDLRSIDYIATSRRVENLEAWQAELQGLAARVVENAKDLRRSGLFPDTLEGDVEAFGAFRDSVDALSTPRPEAEWLEVTLQLLRRDFFDFRRRLCKPVGERWGSARLDQRGVVHLERLLAEWAQLDHPDDPLEPAEWYALLRRLLEANELVLSTPMQTGVQILEAHDAALTPFRYTFLIHANDGEFPRFPGSADILSNEERVRLHELGIPVSHREEALRRERSLWHAVAAGENVFISYRTTDPGGTPLLPSLMVPDHDASKELPRTREPRGDPVSPAQAERVAALALRQSRQAGGRGGVSRVIHAPRPCLLRHCVVAAVAESRRNTSPEILEQEHPALRPNPWNGELRDPAILDYLKERFDNDYVWSAGQLESYSRCPFVFLVERILRLEEMAEAEEETTPLTFGGIAHDLLERFYREVKDDLPASFDGNAAQVFERIADEVIAERESSGEWLGIDPLWLRCRASVRDDVRAYLEWELPYLSDKREQPYLVEHEFGFDEEEPVYLEGSDLGGATRRLRIRGRIDRVDVYDGKENRHRVLDYKKSSIPRAGGYADGSVLQAPLYMAALIDAGLAVDKGRYRAVQKPGDPMNGAEIKAGTDRFEAALRYAFSIPERVRRGWFEPVYAAKAGEWPWYLPGRDVCRSAAQLPEGSRFDG